MNESREEIENAFLLLAAMLGLVKITTGSTCGLKSPKTGVTLILDFDEADKPVSVSVQTQNAKRKIFGA